MLSQMNVVSDEKIPCECGLKRRDIMWMFSEMNRSQMWWSQMNRLQMKWSHMNGLKWIGLNCLQTVNNQFWTSFHQFFQVPSKTITYYVVHRNATKLAWTVRSSWNCHIQPLKQWRFSLKSFNEFWRAAEQNWPYVVCIWASNLRKSATC